MTPYKVSFMAEKKKAEGPTPTERMFGDVLEILKTGGKTQVNPADIDPEQLLKDLQATLDDLRAEADKLSEKTGMSRDELQAYSSNPNNFTKEEWQLLGQIRGELDKYRQQARSLTEAGPEAVFGGIKSTKRETANPKEAPKKPSGKRRKEWMQM
jgi:hypothetical protein